MTDTSSELTEIPRDALEELRDRYLDNWPHNCVGYYTLDNFIRWIKIDPHIKALSIFTLNNDWFDGMFLVIDRYQLFINTLKTSNDRLTTALSLLDWSRGYKVSSFLERHRPAVLSVVHTKELKKEYDSLTVVYHISCGDAVQMEINCPEDMLVKPMTEQDATIADSVWPNRHEGSLFFLKRLSKWNPSLGVFRKDTGELVAWSFRLQGGFLGALQVKDSYKRKGLGSLILRAISKKIGGMGHDVIACVGQNNIPSRKIFERNGFKVIDTAFWLRTYPTIDFTWSDD